MNIKRTTILLLLGIILLASVVFSFPYREWEEENVFDNQNRIWDIRDRNIVDQRMVNITKIGNRVQITMEKGITITVDGDASYDYIRRLVRIQFERDGRVIEKEVEIEKFYRIVDNIDYLTNLTINNFRFRRIEKFRNRLELRNNRIYLVIENEIPVRVLWIFRMTAKVGTEAELDEEYNIREVRFIRPWWWIFVTNQE
ncbi:MAG: hypothetical protein QXW13_00045 [Nanopusillaceae archaeon]